MQFFLVFKNKTTISDNLDGICSEKILQVFYQFMAHPSFLSLCCVRLMHNLGGNDN